MRPPRDRLRLITTLPSVPPAPCSGYADLLPMRMENPHPESLQIGGARPGLDTSSAVATVQLPTHLRLAERLSLFLDKHHISSPVTYLSDPRLQLLELAPAFRFLRTPQGFRELADELTSFSRGSAEGTSLLRTTGPHLLALLPTTGKQRLLSHVLKERNKSTRKHCAYTIVRSCVSREELFTLLTPQHITKMLLLKHKPLDEIIGKVETLRALRNIQVPPYKTPGNAITIKEGRRLARAQIEAVRDTAKRAKKELENLTRVKPSHLNHGEDRPQCPSPRALTDTYVTISAIARRAELILTDARYSPREMQSFIAKATLKLRVACSDGLRLSQSHALPGRNLWTERRVEKLLQALSVIPEGHRLMTPTLRVFHMAPLKSLGEWRLSGRVVLGVPGVLKHNQKDEFGGASHMVGVTIHEVAHSLHMSGASPHFSWEASTGIPLTPTNPLFDLATFASLSTWRVVGYVPREQVIGRDSVRLGAHLIPLNRPLKVPPDEHLQTLRDTFKGDWVVFRYNSSDKLLYAHAATAAFARSANASSDPFEDWAETFSDYFLCPRDLLALAPEKFYYMELHIKRYHLTRDLPILREMYTALQKSRNLKKVPSPLSFSPSSPHS